MEIDPCLHSISTPINLDQSELLPANNGQDPDDLPFPLLNHDDDVCLDPMLFLDDNILMDLLEPQQLPSSCEVPQQEKLAAEEHNHNFQELSLTDLLVMCAESVESDNWHLASSLIVRLEHLLFDTENETSPFLRLAYLFTQGLKSRAIGILAVAPAQAPTPISDDMSAYQMVQELSPFLKFAHFTANQAILEASAGDMQVHIIDFDVVEGLQWPPLMADLANRNGASLRITALVSDANADLASLTGRRLVEFAESIGFTLLFDLVKLKDLEDLQVCRGSVIANCLVQQSPVPSESLALVRTFLSAVRKLSPKMVVLVEEELFRTTRVCPSVPFVEFFCEALHHFSSISDSLASSFYGGYKIGLRLVEKEMLGPRIMDYLCHFPFGSYNMEGFKMIPLSSANVSQAKYLLGLFNRGFSVQHENGRLSLCWKSRTLIGVSTWIPT